MKLSEIKEIIQMFNDSKIDKLSIVEENFSINLKKNKIISNVNRPQIQQIQQEVEYVAPQSAKIDNKANKEESINAPMVGTFYQSPSPTSEVFVKKGDKVRKGQKIGIIEAMKIMNELEAEFDCKIIDILAENATPVEFGTKLFLIERI